MESRKNSVPPPISGATDLVGFGLLPDQVNTSSNSRTWNKLEHLSQPWLQVYRKAVKKGFEFSLMVVGESGLGKSTLVNIFSILFCLCLWHCLSWPIHTLLHFTMWIGELNVLGRHLWHKRGRGGEGGQTDLAGLADVKATMIKLMKLINWTAVKSHPSGGDPPLRVGGEWGQACLDCDRHPRLWRRCRQHELLEPDPWVHWGSVWWLPRGRDQGHQGWGW